MRNTVYRMLMGGVALLLAVGLHGWVTRQQATLAAWQAVWPRVVLWREAHARVAKQPMRRPVEASALAAWLTRQVGAAGLAEYWDGLPEQQAAQVTFRFKAVPFDQASAWLETLLQQYRVRVVAWQVVRGTSLGRVDMRLTLGLAGSAE